MVYHFETHTSDAVATWIQTNLSNCGSYGYLESRIIECENDDKANLFVKFLKLLYDLDFNVVQTQLQYEEEINQYIEVTFCTLITFLQLFVIF